MQGSQDFNTEYWLRFPAIAVEWLPSALVCSMQNKNKSTYILQQLKEVCDFLSNMHYALNKLTHIITSTQQEHMTTGIQVFLHLW